MYLRKSILLVFVFLVPVSLFSQETKFAVHNYSAGVSKLEITTQSNAFNVVVFAGDEGCLLVDTGDLKTSADLKQKISELWKMNVKYIVNTHLHNDHMGGNGQFHPEAAIITHANVPIRLNTGLNIVQDVHENDMPDLMPENKLTLKFNGQIIEIHAVPPAHTDTDMLVYFPEAKILCVGDVFLKNCYPLVDTQGGGNVSNFTKVVKNIIESYPADVTLITGHGDDLHMQDLKNYYKMIVESTALVNDLSKANKDAQEAGVKEINEKWDQTWGQSFLSTGGWIRSVATSFSPQTKKESVIVPLYPFIKSGDMAGTLNKYKELHKTSRDRYDFGEGQLNFLGYNLLSKNRVQDAIIIFQLNQEMYPDAVNVYDSLGEAFEEAGDLNSAAMNYQKAVALGEKAQDRNIELYQKNLKRVTLKIKKSTSVK
ncbi:MAG: MBL fold metallo-hydrolase [Calditrichaeota bacterium]|nr:MAG: MBL fold metallo-hydrolase [Calditrichota bacterium]